LHERPEVLSLRRGFVAEDETPAEGCKRRRMRGLFVTGC
jgi:hypothetical protein